MFGIINLITGRLNRVNFTQPLSVVDLVIAISIVVFTLAYLRRFPVFRVLLGVAFLLVLSVLFFLAGFLFTALVFGVATNIILIALPLIFAPEIRHYLEKIGRFSFLRSPVRRVDRGKVPVNALVGEVFDLAEERVGATIVIQRRTGLGETVESGTLLDAIFSPKLFQSIFFPNNTLHDGAVVMRGNRVVAANCLLPIYSEVKLDPPFGTRHAAAIGITRDTDAVVLAVSEQRGQVSLAENGRLHTNLKKEELKEILQKLV